MPNYTPQDIARLDIRRGFYMLSPDTGGVIDLRERYKTGYAIPLNRERENRREALPWGVPLLWFYRGESSVWLARWGELKGDAVSNPVGAAVYLPDRTIHYI